MNRFTGHPVVDAIANLNLQGNLVPDSWYQHIRYTNKRGEFTDPWAVLVLAEIVFWYQPKKVVEGETINYFKRFSDDKLQRSPEDFCFLFDYGCSTKVIRESLKLLESLSLIDIELRSVKTEYGTVPNTMFIGLNAQKLAEITESAEV